MSGSRLSLVALLLVLPVVASAQRKDRKPPEPMKMDKPVDNPVKDLEKLNPVALVIDKKKDLKLADAEVNALKSINDQLKGSLKPHFRVIDSIAKEMRKTKEDRPTSGQMMIGRSLTREATDSVVAAYEAAFKDALTKLTEEHQKPAMELIDKLKQEQQNEARAGSRPPVE